MPSRETRPRGDAAHAEAGVAAGRAYALFAAIAVAVVAVDQLVKAWARASLAPGATLTLVPGVLGLTLVENPGAAFGVLSGHAAAFVVCALVVVAACALAVGLMRPRSWGMVASLGLVCGGGVGNVIDRVWQGRVTDMFATLFVDFPVFNVADVAITCGFALLVILIVLGGRK